MDIDAVLNSWLLGARHRSLAPATAAQLLLFAKGFTQVQTYRQRIAKAGLCPREYGPGKCAGQDAHHAHRWGLIRSKRFLCNFAAKQSFYPFAAIRPL